MEYKIIKENKEIRKEYLVLLLGVYSNFDEIDFDVLSEKFVLMTNHSY
ncbi:hypothetical protein [Clostridium nigeriense]|nr:hypothetical protein [Clostridium nigeriense]